MRALTGRNSQPDVPLPIPYASTVCGYTYTYTYTCTYLVTAQARHDAGSGLQAGCRCPPWTFALCRLKSWVDHLLWDREQRTDEMYRMKGLLSVKGSERKHMLQVRAAQGMRARLHRRAFAAPSSKACLHGPSVLCASVLGAAHGSMKRGPA